MTTHSVIAGWSRDRITAHGRQLRERVLGPDLPGATCPVAVAPRRLIAPIVRTCPECDEPVLVGQVRHGPCYRRAVGWRGLATTPNGTTTRAGVPTTTRQEQHMADDQHDDEPWRGHIFTRAECVKVAAALGITVETLEARLRYNYRRTVELLAFADTVAPLVSEDPAMWAEDPAWQQPGQVGRELPHRPQQERLLPPDEGASQ